MEEFKSWIKEGHEEENLDKIAKYVSIDPKEYVGLTELNKDELKQQLAEVSAKLILVEKDIENNADEEKESLEKTARELRNKEKELNRMLDRDNDGSNFSLN
jgi:uncharacterized FlaG/YvyC family protein